MEGGKGREKYFVNTLKTGSLITGIDTKRNEAELGLAQWLKGLQHKNLGSWQPHKKAGAVTNVYNPIAGCGSGDRRISGACRPVSPSVSPGLTGRPCLKKYSGE